MTGEIKTFKIKHVKASLIGNLIETFCEMLPIKVETITSKSSKAIKIWVNTPANTVVVGINADLAKATEEDVLHTWELIERLIEENDIPTDRTPQDDE